MSFKSIVVLLFSTICAISLFVSVSIKYLNYETNTSVTRETDGDIEAISVCVRFNYRKFGYNRLLELTSNVRLSDIVEFGGIEAKTSLKFHRTNIVCFRLLERDTTQNISVPELNGLISFSWKLRPSPSINKTIFGSQISIIVHSPYEIPGGQRQIGALSTDVHVDYTRVARLPGITCTNIENRYEDSREACVRREVLLNCPNLHTGPVLADELESMNKSNNADLIFPSHNTRASLEHQKRCKTLTNDLRFGKCYKLNECIEYYEISVRTFALPPSKPYFHITKGVETLVEYSLKLNLRDYIIELLSIFATTYGWSVFTIQSITRKHIKYITLRRLVEVVILVVAISGLMYQLIGLIIDYTNYDSRTELRLLKADRHFQLPFFDICSDRNSSLNSTAFPLGYYQTVPAKTVFVNEHIVCQRHQLLTIDSKEDSYDINSMIVELTTQSNATIAYLDITMYQVLPSTDLPLFKHSQIKALQRFQNQLLQWPYKGNCYNYREFGLSNRRDCVIHCFKNSNISIKTLITQSVEEDHVCHNKCSKPDCFSIKFELHNTYTKNLKSKPYSLTIQHSDAQQEITEKETISTGNLILSTIGIICFWLGLSANGLTRVILKRMKLCSIIQWQRRTMKRIRLTLRRLLNSIFLFGCIFSSITLMVIYFKYEITTSSEVIELLRIPIEAMDVKCYIETHDENRKSHDVLMQEFIAKFNNTRIHILSQSGKFQPLRSATKSVSYYMRSTTTTTMMLAHVEFNEEMSNIHVRRFYDYGGRLIAVENSRNQSNCQLYLTLTTREDISTMKSESELRLSSMLANLQPISQQLLPPPYETMCSPHISTRVTCLDKCLQLGLNNEGRLVLFINRTVIKGTENRESIALKCRKLCSRRPCTGSFFESVMYQYPHKLSLIGMSLTEQRLLTSPKMAFAELLINLLKIIGIWVGLSISDCIKSLTNGLIWLYNQRIFYETRLTFHN